MNARNDKTLKTFSLIYYQPMTANVHPRSSILFNSCVSLKMHYRYQFLLARLHLHIHNMHRVEAQAERRKAKELSSPLLAAHFFRQFFPSRFIFKFISCFSIPAFLILLLTSRGCSSLSLSDFSFFRNNNA
jgi:hypothetical protein